MNPVIFSAGLTFVTYESGEEIPFDLQLYYWHSSTHQYKPIGTLREIQYISEENYVNGKLDGINTRLGTTSSVVLYYNSTPHLPISHTLPEAERIRAERIRAEEAERIRAERIRAEEAERKYAQRQAQRQAEQAERIRAERIRAEEAERMYAQRRAQRQAEQAQAEEAQRQAQRLVQRQAEESKFPENDDASIDSVNRLLCGLCFAKTKNLVFNCGHSICDACKNQLRQQKCPFCTKPINIVIPLNIGGHKNYKEKYLKYKQKYFELSQINK